MLSSTSSALSAFSVLTPLLSHSNMSKAATSHFGAMLSTMLAESGIRCNTLEPGLYPSDMTAAQGARHAATGHRELEGTNGAAIPAGRAGWPHE
jgi:NAD(P)-dependent dehydrogenase (short-subunit alcohol dehydrogenase family)